MRVIGAPVHVQLVVVYGLSAFIAGLAGALWAETNAFVSLDVLSLDVSIYALAMLILGGIGRLYGAILGAAVYMCVQYFTQELNPSYWMFAIGLLLILVVRFGRGGLLGLLASALRRSHDRGAPT
jgi:branched-chain amino acid transport system permease protein